MPISTVGRSNNQAGFTLVELVLVVLLLGLLASLTMPLLGRGNPGNLNGVARRLAGTVKYLYNEAAMTGLEQRLVFDLGDGSYWSQERSESGELERRDGMGRRYRLPESVAIESIYQPRNGEYRSGEVITRMQPGGWLDETIIHLRDEDERKLTLRLVPLTGLTEFYEGYRDFR